jgi:hypothetical protein
VIELDFELRLALDKVGSPVLANWILVTLSKLKISHIFCKTTKRLTFLLLWLEG